MNHFLFPGETHIWYVRFELIPHELLLKYRLIISSDEERKFQSYIFEKDRNAYLISRALLRSVLSSYYPVTPQDWRFNTRPFGKPEVAMPAEAVSLRFNISHTSDLAACAVANASEVGIDVEDVTRKTLDFDLARSVFSPLEIKYLETISESRLTRALFEIWTLKESYVKALGIGFTKPLKDFSFELDPIRLILPEAESSEADLWQFSLFRPTENHLIALTYRKQTDTTIKIMETIPFADK